MSRWYMIVQGYNRSSPSLFWQRFLRFVPLTQHVNDLILYLHLLKQQHD
jgi:hypothetical protein